MRARRLQITPEVWIMMLSRPDGWRVIKNRLPEDAKLARILFDHDSVEAERHPTVPGGMEPRWTISLWIVSSVFLDTDPVDLPAPELEAIPLVPDVRLRFETDRVVCRTLDGRVITEEEWKARMKRLGEPFVNLEAIK